MKYILLVIVFDIQMFILGENYLQKTHFKNFVSFNPLQNMNLI